MSKRSDQTASFMVRFTQKIYYDKGESKVQWRGRISHVQGGEQESFSDFNDAVKFIQEKLADLTLKATEHETPEEQDGILAKSFDIWKKMASSGPKILKEVIRDPKGQVAQFQDQIQDQINQVSDEISTKVELDQWRNASKSDFKLMMEALENLSDQVKSLNDKVDLLKAKK